MRHLQKTSFYLRATRLLLPGLVVVALVSLTFAQNAKDAAWGLTQFDGEDYVSVKGIQSFYRFTKVTRQENIVRLENEKIHMKLQVGAQECLINQVKFILADPVRASGDGIYVSRMDLVKLIDPVLRPNFIKSAAAFRTVILDPGHGGHDAGARNTLGTEANYNLKLAQEVKRRLIAKGFQVKMTRESDRYLSLQERVDFANAHREPAIFISLHFNSGNWDARGIETFTLSPPGVSHYGANFKASDDFLKTGNQHDSANIALATALHGSILRRLGSDTLDRGIKRARFDVLSGVRHPAVLFEGGFMSHPEEARKIAQASYQEKLASGIVESIIRYRYAVGKRR